MQPLEKQLKKPKQERALQTIDTICEAAARILEEDGSEALTTNRIAERAGFSIGTFYFHFPDKTAVLVALAQRDRARMRARIVEILDEYGTAPLEILVRQLMHLALQAFEGRNVVRRAVIRTMMARGRSAEFSVALDELSAFILGRLAESDRPEAGMMTVESMYVLTRAVLGTVRSAVMESAPVLGTMAFEDQLVRLAMGYLTYRPDDVRSPPEP